MALGTSGLAAGTIGEDRYEVSNHWQQRANQFCFRIQKMDYTARGAKLTPPQSARTK
jgi:hypothetical protein